LLSDSPRFILAINGVLRLSMFKNAGDKSSRPTTSADVTAGIEKSSLKVKGNLFGYTLS
jgi:hypothetical protein